MLKSKTPLPIAELRSAMQGELFLPGDPLWDSARTPWNLQVDQHPECVAVPETPEDVQAVVRSAAEAGLGISVQGTGHNAAAYESLANRVLIRTHRMRAVRIDPKTKRAHVQAGAIWADVVGPAAEHGLAALQGSSHDVGVVGYSLGGGVSFLARKHGLASERLHAVEIVSADGELRRVSHDNEKDLFWALRGGGGNFGVVTSVEIDLLERDKIYAGTLFYEFERSREILGAWAEWTRIVPEEMTSVGRILQFPPLPDLPPELSGQSYVVVEAFWLGSEEEGERLLRPLRDLAPVQDTVGMIGFDELLQVHMDPPEPVPGYGDHQMLDELTPEVLDALVEVAGPGSGSSLLSMEFRHAGGALSRREPNSGALGRIEGEFMTFAVALTGSPEAFEAAKADAKRVREALEPVETGTHYLNFTEHPVPVDTIYGKAAMARLHELKDRYDPAGMFAGNHPISAS